jgi:iron(III) transport system ATP-binding protein
MDRLQVNQIDVSYGKNQVVKQVSFSLGEGQLGCLLGPSGCGKTTVLLSIAGFQEPDSGRIIINDTVVSDGKLFVAPEKRHVGMVFQDYALFPNLSVADNIGFGIQHLEKTAQQARVNELLGLVNLTELANAFPHQLSGGQQQRVALARAMAPRPSILLLDEPFSNLDVELREQLASEVRQILKQENVTAILVTHDQHEAFAMADDICVMHQGQIQQQDNPVNLYHQPANHFVAGFIGEGVLLEGSITLGNILHTDLGDMPIQTQLTDKLDVLVRPDDIVIEPKADLRARVVRRTFRGASYLYELELASGCQVLSLSPSEQVYDVDSEVGLLWQPAHMVIFPRS